MQALSKQRLTKKQKRALKNQLNIETSNRYINLKYVRPLTENQSKVLDNFDKHKIIHGSAGTGKTFLSSYIAIKEVLDENTPYEKLIYIRSSVATRDIGFLPGNHNEKMAIFEAPYVNIMAELFEKELAYKILKADKKVDFCSSSFLRGMTFDNCIIIVDEFQNMSWHELYTIMTRIGNNCKIIFSGDYKQSDLSNTKTGCVRLMDVCSRLDEFDFIEMTNDDIIRSKLVKDFIIMSEKLGYT